MNLTVLYGLIVDFLKKKAKESGIKLTDKDIASRLGINKTYFSEMLNGKVEVKQHHIEYIKCVYMKELGIGEHANLQAKYDILLEEFIKLKIKVDGGGDPEKIRDDIHLRSNKLLESRVSWQPSDA